MPRRLSDAVSRLLAAVSDVLAVVSALQKVSPEATPAATSPDPPGDTAGPRLTPIQADALEAVLAAGRPRKGVLLARDCNRPYNSHFREALSQLCQLGLIVRGEGGYAPPVDTGT